MLQSKENRHLFNLVKDDTSSLLWLRDAESCGTDRSVVNEKLELIDTEFDFDREIFSSKVYQMAARSSMIPALLGGQNDGKPAASFPATVTDSNSPMEADVDKCDEQTIQERPVDTYQPTSQLQIPMVRRSQNTETTGSTEVPQGLRPKSVSHLKSPDRLPVSVSKEREKRGSVQAREQVYRKLLQIPVSFKPQSLSPITLQQDLENFKTTENQSVKVIILGSSESGKSTLFKSIYVHQGAYTDDIRRFYKLIIFKNILDNIQSALEAREMFSLKDAKIDLQYQEFEGHRRTWLTSNIEPDKIIMSPEIASAIKALWNEPSVREVVEMPHEYYIMDCAK